VTWSITRDGSTMHLDIQMPVADWGELLDSVQAALEPRPNAVVLPSSIEGATATDAQMLRVLWDALASVAVPLVDAADADRVA
jgi:hypothetical protein